MTLTDLFPNVGNEKIRLVFTKHNIVVPSNFHFSPVNIIIGPNGGGKTRFLNAIKELYEIDKRQNILYGYFPSLSDKKVVTDSANKDLPDLSLLESMYTDDVSFSDFFKEIEAHNEAFIPELLVYHSRRQKERGEKALQIVKKSFHLLTGKTLIVKLGNIYIKDTRRKPQLLADALSQLSPGELILFYMSIFLAVQQNGKKNKAIVLDEPESHLHPKALLNFIKLLQESNEYKEIWIATHSLFMIPEFQFENIVYIQNSQIQNRSSSIYQSIFDELLGDKDKNVQRFFSSLSQWKYCEFIAECFTDPKVIDKIDPKDEQVQLFLQYFNECRPLRILDCGGGSGRLGLSLEAAKPDIFDYTTYHIYDKTPIYKGGKFNVYENLEDIDRTYHCVVMMNFLHEVDPAEWEDLFRKIYNLMDRNTYLLFVEVSTLNQGEMPNSSGYFILGEKELNILFNDSKKLISAIREKESQKSLFTVIPSSLLLNVNQKSIYNAICFLEKRMMEEIKKFRASSNLNTRHYAFLLQQYINAKLFLEAKEVSTDHAMLKGRSQPQVPFPRRNATERLTEVQGATLKERTMEGTLGEGVVKGTPETLRETAPRRKTIMELPKEQKTVTQNPRMTIDHYGARSITSLPITQPIKSIFWTEIISYINSFLTNGYNRVYSEDYSLLIDVIGNYQNNKTISDTQINQYLSILKKLESNRMSKELLAVFSAALVLMTDPYGENHLKNRDFAKYLPEKIKSLLI